MRFMKKNALVVGGGNGIGLSVSQQLLLRGYDKVHILDKFEPEIKLGEKVVFHRFNLTNDDYSILERFTDIDTLVITAGFGRIDTFDNILDIEIINSYKVNAVAVCRIIKFFYFKLLSSDDFYCTVMGSIAGLVSSPMFALYGATKAAVCKFTESVNIELEKQESVNRILNVSPGSIKGTKFDGGTNDPSQTEDLANEILDNMFRKNTLFIPQLETIYSKVLNDYATNPHEFGLQSFDYKVKSGRKRTAPQISIGYLSGTFDLFHIGHLNILQRAKEYCDYLVVGIHKDALHKGKETFISFEERCEIVKNIKYVDKVIQSRREDMDVYAEIPYRYLFVGSDYRNSARFLAYEEYFKDKNVKIVYFPYTQTTNSTQLRNAILDNIKNK
jgi:glycerol-3-phosphate cytidylyltransferase